jgi:acetolactate synthase-1/2/3 large subunit
MLNIQELEVVKRLNLPIKFFILNNNGYGSIRGTQKRFFGRFTASSKNTGMTLPDIREVAKGFGIETSVIKSNSDLNIGIRKVLESEGPFLCEVLSNPEVETMPRVSSKQLPNGTIVSLPMEDMYPFLDRDILKREILAPY